MRAALLLGALAQLGLAAAIGWVVGDSALRWAGGHISRVAGDGLPDGIGLPERALASIGGFTVFAAAAMAVHMVGGGAVFGAPWIVPVAGAAVLLLGISRRRWPRRVPWPKAGLFAALLVAVYVTPVLIEGSGVRAGDSSWHMGWTEQLLAGEVTPSGPAPEFGSNAYPWGWHAFSAALVRLVPGSSPLVAQEALHLLILFGLPLGAACLARRIMAGTGWAAAGAASLIGGWGWLVARGPEFVASPREARFGADLVAASPNSVYELLPPAFPRELGLVVLGLAGVLLVLAVRTEDRRLAVCAGAACGLVGLVSVPLFVSGLLWMLVAALLAGRGARLRMLAAMGLPALATFALWAGPTVAKYVRYGGFVNITSRLGVEWPLPVALAAWGLLLPAALAGLYLAARRSTTSARVVLGFAAAAALMLLLARARAAFQWDLAGNATVLHEGRVWPVAHLLGAAFAGVALKAAYDRLARSASGVAGAGAAAFFLLGAVSPVLASGGMTEVLRTHEGGFMYGSSDFQPGSFVIEAARVLDPGDVVDTTGGPEANALGFWLFQFSGCRIAAYDDVRLSNNDLRIRYAELAASYDARMGSTGFIPDYRAAPISAALRPAPGAVVVEGEYRGETWQLVRLGDE